MASQRTRRDQSRRTRSNSSSRKLSSETQDERSCHRSAHHGVRRREDRQVLHRQPSGGRRVRLRRQAPQGSRGVHGPPRRRPPAPPRRRGEGRRYRPRYHQLRGRRHGGWLSHHRDQLRGWPHHPLRRRLRQERRPPRRPDRQASGRGQPREHLLLRQALHRPPLGRGWREGPRGALLRGQGRHRQREDQVPHRRQGLRRRGDLRAGPPQALRRRRLLPRRHRHQGGHHRPRLLQRLPAPGDQGCR
mmetsp:Transcript_6690/g.27254  ORF Transcript_6690/g.27254 Transcript_6690/m.27254 type:complete len:246 (-) Transcript_6690:1747-2484(-)